MSTFALYDTFATGSPGLIAGRVSDSGHTWSNSPTVEQFEPVSFDPTGGAYCANSNTSNGCMAASSWSPPSANYGLAARCELLGSGILEVGVAIRLVLVSGAFPRGYFGQMSTAANSFFIARGDSATFTTLASVPHTFTSGELHDLYLTAENDGTGGVNLTLYVDGVSTVTYHDTSASALLGAGLAGIRGYSPSGSTTSGAHVVWVQTDPQACTLAPSSPASGTVGVASGAWTLRTEVPVILATTATMVDDHSAAFSPTSLAFAAGASSATLTLNPSAAGTHSVTAAVLNPALTSNAATYTASPAGPTTITMPTTPTTSITAVESAPIIFTTESALTGNTTFHFASSVVGDTFCSSLGGASLTSYTVNSGAAFNIYLVAISPGPRDITISSPGMTVVNSPLTITASQLTLSMTGPSNGIVGQEAFGFGATVNTSGTATRAITVALASDGSGDVFRTAPGGPSVTSVRIPTGTNSADFGTVPATVGLRHISGTSAGAKTGLAVAVTAAALNVTLGTNPIDVGDTGTATATGFTGGAVTWTSADPSVATINSSTGAYTGVGTGTNLFQARGVTDTGQVYNSATLTVGNPPTAGTATAGATTSTTAAATATAATAGTAPYTYQWYRSVASGVLGAAVSGQVTRTLADTGLTPSTTYFYTLRYTDATSVHADSNQVTEATAAAVPASDQVQVYYPAPSLATCYFVVTQPGGKAFNGTSFESLNAAHWPSYAVPLADTAGVSVYLGTMPTPIPPGTVSIYAYLRSGGTPAPTDPIIGDQLDASWDGTALSSTGSGGSLFTTGQLAQLDAALSPLFCPVVKGATATTVTLADSDAAVAAAGSAAGRSIWLTVQGGNGAFQSRPLGARVGTTQQYTVPAWETTPAAGDPYYLYAPDLGTASAAASAVFALVGGIVPGRASGETLSDMRAVLCGDSTDVPAGAGLRTATFLRTDGTPAIAVNHDGQGNGTNSAIIAPGE